MYENRLGKLFAAETGFRLGHEPGPSVRAPDIAFVANDRVALTDTAQFIAIAPDLAVETLPLDDRASQVSEKVQWWLAQGAKLVWVVDPENKAVAVHAPGGRSQHLRNRDTLVGDDVLPGFDLPLSELFQ